MKVSKKTKEELEKENKDLKSKIELLEHDLIHDELTGLKTRKYLVDLSKAYLKALFPLRDSHRELDAEGKREHISFLFCDIDFFKKVNDTFGHAAGDQVLKQVADVLQTHVRDLDIVARFGGEEVIVALFNITKDEATQAAEKLRSVVEGLTFSAYPKLHVTMSVGVASTEDSYEDPSIEPGRIDRLFDEYIRRADSAVYVAKDTGRNRVVVWSPDIEERQHSKSIRAKLLQALRGRKK